MAKMESEIRASYGGLALCSYLSEMLTLVGSLGLFALYWLSGEPRCVFGAIYFMIVTVWIRQMRRD